MYILVGANGFIGTYLLKNIREMVTDNILALGRNINELKSDDRVTWQTCDVTDRADIDKLSAQIKDMKNVKVIYLAAYHHPDKVKENPKLAWDVNVTSLSYFLNKVENITSLFYISTEMVYGDGKIGMKFNESSMLNPINQYGKQKKVAESLILGYGYNVVRFPFVIGPSLLKSRKHFYDIIVETLSEGKVMEMFEDSYKSALDFNTATSLVVELTQKKNCDIPPIINVAGDEILTKFDIGIKIARANNLDSNLIVPIKLNQDKTIFSEQRSDCTLLDNSLLKQILNKEKISINF